MFHAMFLKLGFFVLLHALTVACGKSPHYDEQICTSKFDFEEKLLEKMVKLSHEFNILEEKVDARTKQMEKSLMELEAKLNSNLKELTKKGQNRCPDEWVVFGEGCYNFAENNKDFNAAVEFCSANGGSLVHIETEEENVFVQNQLRKLQGEKFWIGLTDTKEEGTWLFSGTNTRALYLDWGRHQPNNGRVSNCGAIWKSFNYHWVDEPCSNSFQPVCEMKTRN